MEIMTLHHLAACRTFGAGRPFGQKVIDFASPARNLMRSILMKPQIFS
jgi:hypothetical protein